MSDLDGPPAPDAEPDGWDRLFRYLIDGPDEAVDCPHLVAFGLMDTANEPEEPDE